MRILFAYNYSKENMGWMFNPIPENVDMAFIQNTLGFSRVTFMDEYGRELFSFDDMIVDVLANISVGFGAIESGRATQGVVVDMEPFGDRPLWFEKFENEYVFHFRNGKQYNLSAEKLRTILAELATFVFASLAFHYRGITKTEGYAQWKEVIARDLSN